MYDYGGGSILHKLLYLGQPGILPDQDREQSHLEDAQDGILSRNTHRLREIALHEIITITARQRVKAAQNSRTRQSLQVNNYRYGDNVEFWRKPVAKGLSGWRGPAKVVHTDIEQAVVHIKYQGKSYECRNQDVRPALLYPAYNATLAYHVAGSAEPYDCLRVFVNNMEPKQRIHLGFYKEKQDWHLQKAVKTHQQLFHEVLHVASNNAGLHNCVGARLARGTSELPPLPHYETSVIWHWSPYDVETSGYIHYNPHETFHIPQFADQSLALSFLA